jgi:hypothetical protein
MALLPFENAPFFAIYFLPNQGGGGTPGRQAEKRESGQREAWSRSPSRDDEHHVQVVRLTNIVVDGLRSRNPNR